MKRICTLLLTLCMLVCLCACGTADETVKAPVDFYYPRVNLTYWENDSVIASEVREAYGHTEDLNYLVLLYLRGPASQELYSPFPANTGLAGLEQKNQTLTITLSGISLSEQSRLQTSLACACLAKTCFALADVTSVRVNTVAGRAAGESDIVVDADSLLLWDVCATVPTDTTENN